MTDNEHDLLEGLRADLNKQHGTDLRWGSDDGLLLRLLPLGIPQLDRILGGGFAFNRITLIVGEYSAGKTVVAMQALAAAQRLDIPAVYIDVERTWESEWARALGVDPDNVLVSQPRTGEAAFDVCKALVRQEPAGVIVVDSLAAMTAADEIEDGKTFDDKYIGNQARLINRGLRTLVSENTGWAIVVVNQTRTSIGGYGDPTVLPGGKGQGFYAWQLLKVRRKAASWITEDGKAKGTRLGFTMVIRLEKNKQGAPFQECELPFYFTGQFDELAGVIGVAVDLGLLGEPPRYTFEDQKWYGRPKMLDAFRDDDELFERLVTAIDAVPVLDF